MNLLLLLAYAAAPPKARPPRIPNGARPTRPAPAPRTPNFLRSGIICVSFFCCCLDKSAPPLRPPPSFSSTCSPNNQFLIKSDLLAIDAPAPITKPAIGPKPVTKPRIAPKPPPPSASGIYMLLFFLRSLYTSAAVLLSPFTKNLSKAPVTTFLVLAINPVFLSLRFCTAKEPSAFIPSP